jgi:hypothetical protein
MIDRRKDFKTTKLKNRNQKKHLAHLQQMRVVIEMSLNNKSIRDELFKLRGELVESGARGRLKPLAVFIESALLQRLCFGLPSLVWIVSSKKKKI